MKWPLQEGAGLTKRRCPADAEHRASGGEGPDLLILDGADLESFSGSGLLLDLSGMVDTGSLYDFVTDRYTDADGKLFTLPARFTVPVMHGAAGTLDGVSTLDDVAALVQQYAPRPAEASWAPLDESQRYALGFDSVDSLVQFALQTSQPALFTADGLDEAKLRDLMAFLQMVGGEDYNMADYPRAGYHERYGGQFRWSGYHRLVRGNVGICPDIPGCIRLRQHDDPSPGWGPPTRNCVLPDRPFCSRDFARASTCLPALRRFPPTAIRRTMRGPS